ncbi:hypothetical protein [Stutzerimonas tarimensis]|uniref:Uncharacterized protein n=1 Tax=Stutzerimonas tarimensis TaxID=1507735 RepID=A0ABV7T192_9GAMM
MSSLNWMITLIFTGFALMGVGFSFRDNNWGVGLLALGSAVMLSSIAYKMYITFSID